MLILPGEGELCLAFDMELEDKSLLSLMTEFLVLSFTYYEFEIIVERGGFTFKF